MPMAWTITECLDKSCRYAIKILEWNKGKCLFRWELSFWQDNIQTWCSWILANCTLHIDISPPTEKGWQSFLGIINYWGTILPVTGEVCKSLQRLTSTKADWCETASTKSYMKNWRPSSWMMYEWCSAIIKNPYT